MRVQKRLVVAALTLMAILHAAFCTSVTTLGENRLLPKAIFASLPKLQIVERDTASPIPMPFAGTGSLGYKRQAHVQIMCLRSRSATGTINLSFAVLSAQTELFYSSPNRGYPDAKLVGDLLHRVLLKQFIKSIAVNKFAPIGMCHSQSPCIGRLLVYPLHAEYTS